MRLLLLATVVLAGFADRRLRHTLTLIAEAAADLPKQQSAEYITSAHLDTWAIVDALDRLRTLMQLVPPKEPSEVFSPALASKPDRIRAVRNVSDHLASRVDYVVARRTPALGRLSWFTLSGELTGLSFLLVPGALAPAPKVGIDGHSRKDALDQPVLVPTQTEARPVASCAAT
ncbi:hypothetical protein QTH91_14530 [Variovorax dokdonensis]|uniref:Uncharacterized protein n=1 Tax=Variovorax dokdonensis TaxID=344883 RepID=A0ABT7NCP4_9BURK|nr:hypothetical protein [Variovorax dokdonensis]MDM0045703.1 hypothetical protein [Variovorax dokdonensis]